MDEVTIYHDYTGKAADIKVGRTSDGEEFECCITKRDTVKHTETYDNFTGGTLDENLKIAQDYVARRLKKGAKVTHIAGIEVTGDVGNPFATERARLKAEAKAAPGLKAAEEAEKSKRRAIATKAAKAIGGGS